MDLALRVAARYYMSVDVKRYQGLFAQAKRKIELDLAQGDIASATKEFKALGEALLPLASVLDDYTPNRSDEQRKLKNVRQWLRRIRYPFKDLDKDDTELRIWINLSLDNIEESLKSLTRVQDRLEGYGSVEKEFSHGPFTVVNKYGYRPDEYANALSVLDTAATKIKAKGFGRVLYGRVVLTASKGSGWAGKYEPTSDTILLNVESKFRMDNVFTLTHEFGHRYWHEVLSSQQQSLYEDLYSNAGGLTLDARQDMFEAIVKADFSFKRAVGYLKDPSLGPALVQWAEYVFSGHPQKYLKQVYESGERWVEKNFVRPNQRYVFPTGKSEVETVSSYAKTNVKEDFAETFATVVSGKPLPPQVEKRWALVR